MGGHVRAVLEYLPRRAPASNRSRCTVCFLTSQEVDLGGIGLIQASLGDEGEDAGISPDKRPRVLVDIAQRLCNRTRHHDSVSSGDLVLETLVPGRMSRQSESLMDQNPRFAQNCNATQRQSSQASKSSPLYRGL
jgi:hypothetical protein